MSQLTVFTNKNTILNFEIAITGAGNTPDVAMHLVIEPPEKPYKLLFELTQDGTDKDKWSIDLPPMGLDKTAHEFYLYAVIEGYYFEPYKGSLTVMDEVKADVTTTSTSSSLSDDMQKLAGVEKKPVNIPVVGAKQKKVELKPVEALKEDKNDLAKKIINDFVPEVKPTQKKKITLSDIKEAKLKRSATDIASQIMNDDRY